MFLFRIADIKWFELVKKRGNVNWVDGQKCEHNKNKGNPKVKEKAVPEESDDKFDYNHENIVDNDLNQRGLESVSNEQFPGHVVKSILFLNVKVGNGLERQL